MSALTRDQYRRLEALAVTYRVAHQQALDVCAGSRRGLKVDALCFGGCPGHPDWLLGAWLTPCHLSLALVRDVSQPSASEAPGLGDRPANVPTDEAFRSPWYVTLPRGEFAFYREALGDSWLWRCELLSDLDDVDDMGEACRLAQRLMDRVMTEASPG
ncbi:hypothetical protein KUW18_15190 [Halomonas sp. DP5Y7-2]|uniref:[NiFe]-hydrogenase assembly chaperone HybE n=1 Tax=Halomonas sp. DP5Y7-2 TaxID=2859076 RepID=UPI001C99E03C|nr:[NiFe]-hydrogenase assembly chaperone HybE [Halomonas sp. DP5Y7-2]MBY5985437.1 hypothetical protein [Halomonas sp. DP5Y7-2]